MPALRLTIDGEQTVIDTDNLMLSELEVLEEHAGVDLGELGTAASLKKVRFLGHLLWLHKLHQIAEAKQVPLHEAALLMPRDSFDVAVGGLEVEVINAPKDPSPGTPKTRTPRAASSKPRKRTAKSASSGSGRSPSTSGSAPGTSSG